MRDVRPGVPHGLDGLFDDRFGAPGFLRHLEQLRPFGVWLWTPQICSYSCGSSSRRPCFAILPFPADGFRRWLLKLFGCKLGKGARVRPRARLHYPWRIEIGDHSAIGDDALALFHGYDKDRRSFGHFAKELSFVLRVMIIAIHASG